MKRFNEVLIPLLLITIMFSACNFLVYGDAEVTETTPAGVTETPDTGASTTQSVTLEPVITSAPPIVDDTPAPIVLLAPGESANGVSRVVSPVTISGEADFPFEGTLSLTITGEDGRVLTQTTTQVDGEYGGRGPFTAEVSFSIDHNQPGRVSVYSVSMRDGGLLYLTSVPVMLLISSSNSIEPAGSSVAPVNFISPLPAETISGGTLVIHGTADQAFENTLNIAICGPGGVGEADVVCGSVDNILESGTSLQAEPSGIDGQLSFSYLFHFFLPSETPARVAVYSISPRDGGIEWLVSVEISLRP
jgi:hypothetical protein